MVVGYHCGRWSTGTWEYCYLSGQVWYACILKYDETVYLPGLERFRLSLHHKRATTDLQLLSDVPSYIILVFLLDAIE